MAKKSNPVRKRRGERRLGRGIPGGRRRAGLPVGIHTLSLPCTDRAPGVYSLRLRAGTEDWKLKVVLTD